ncbi:MAG: phenylalanine--tRNA ligase subunit beta [Candidatus Peregrinibacteria bacterium]|nr:phenylalanine--tRNA ligase subunit beta [Candidatus Peregrinibacteria bacterium]
MLISLNWLKELVDLPENLDPKELATELTIKTAEVDSVINEAESFENIVVGQILEITPHPNADKLRVTKVSLGKENCQIVCGGSNLREGMYVAIAKPGSKVRWHGAGDLITLERTKIRDVESDGMICAGSEIGIPDPTAKEKEILDLSAMKTAPGTPLSELLQKNDVIFEFDNKALTHRPDLWGHYGIAREIAVLTGAKLKPVKSAVKIPAKGEQIEVEVKDEKLCPRYCGLIIDNVKVGPSPDWLQKKLKATGHGTHNNIVDVTNYIMLELGQPMHAFDKAKINKGIVVRTAKKGEMIPCLDDKIRELNEHMLIIADHEKPVAIAGVIGGANSEIGSFTTSIILESANFNSSSVRKTSTKFMLRTDAVQRFEKGLDPHLCELAVKRAAELILEICPEAKIAGPITDISNFSTTPLKITLDTEMARSKIGADISDKQMKEILESLDFEVKAGTKKGTFEVTVPTFRANKDVKIEDDIVEEIARIFGYGNIPATLPTLPTKLPQENTERFKKHRARELLSFGLGFDEVSNYSFYGKNEIERCLMKEEGHVKLLNYLSEDQTHMRTSMTPNLLKNLQHNVKNFDELRIYEIGRTYKEIGEFMPLEEKKIVGAILLKGKSDAPFYEAKGVLETIFKKFEIQLPHPAKGMDCAPYAHPNKAISYIDGHGQTLGKVFMLHPVVAKNHDLENYSIGIFAVNFTELMKLTPNEKKYKKIGRFPSIEFDVSVLVDANIEIHTLKNSIASAEKHLITDVALFDIYQGQGIPSDKKAVAFKITLQAEDRTLTDNEMTETQKFVFKNLEELGGVIRGK